MKNLHISIIIGVGIALIVTNFHSAYAPCGNNPSGCIDATRNETQLNDAILLPFKDSEVVVIGKVITANSTISGNKTEYSIAVEKYLKNPKPYDLLTAVGDGIRKEITNFSKTKYYNAPIFEEGNRVFLYLNQKNGKYVISPYSFGITKKMSGSPEPVDFTVYQNQYYGNDAITISGRIVKGYLYSSAAEYGANSTVSIMVSNPKNQRYLSDTLDVKPDGSFSYKFKIKGKLGITGDYESDLLIGWSSTGIAFEYFASPLKQLESGIASNKIKCREDLELIFKPSNNNPACVKPDTAGKLIKRGWAKKPNPVDLHVTSNQIVNVVAIKSVPPVNPGGPAVQLTLRNAGMLPITNLKAILEINANYTFDFENVTPSTPLLPGNTASDTKILIGAGFRNELAYSLIISGIKNNMPFQYIENVYVHQ